MAGTGPGLGLIRPDWPAPPQVVAAAMTRTGGHSTGCYASLNLAQHVGDQPESVRRNRRLLSDALDLPAEPCWLEQMHGSRVIAVADVTGPVEADAAFADRAGQVCAVLTADCLPVLLADRHGSHIAAVHAGWRGLQAGVLAASVAALARRSVEPGELLAWLGPAIGAAAYEVGPEVRDGFVGRDPVWQDVFRAGRPGHWQMDLYALARGLLEQAGVRSIYGGDYCTHSDRQFFSHRRDGVTGRQATLIWLRA